MGEATIHWDTEIPYNQVGRPTTPDLLNNVVFPCKPVNNNMPTLCLYPITGKNDPTYDPGYIANAIYGRQIVVNPKLDAITSELFGGEQVADLTQFLLTQGSPSIFAVEVLDSEVVYNK
jgi:hypothetical protein